LGTFVAHVTVDDADSGENGRFHCTVADTNSFALRPLPPHITEFKLVTVAPLDREQRSRHRFTITCRDNGQKPLSSTIPVEIYVTDANDHAPEFAHTAYHVTVSENNAVGASLLRVVASDCDVGPNGEVRYRLDSSKPDVTRLVSVDAITGLVSAVTSFDREATNSVEFEVIAVDCGDPPRSGRTRVHLTISDVDDQLPVFSLPSYTFLVLENQPSGTEVGFVSAIDRDADPFNKFLFSSLRLRNVTSSAVDSATLPFSIDALTGRITTLEPLDRERQDVYELTIAATPTPRNGQRRNGRQPTNEVSAAEVASSCDVTVRIVDVNDNRPTFRFPAVGNDRMVVAAGQARQGHVIARVVAVDADAGHNALIDYRMLYDDAFDRQRGVFTIDRKTGDVRLDVDLEPTEPESVYQLSVVASDSGTPALSERATLHVVFVAGSAESIGSKKSAWPRSANGDVVDNTGVTGEVYGLLASGDLAVVLAVALGAVIVAIAIIVALVCLATTRRRRLHHIASQGKQNNRTFPVKSADVVHNCVSNNAPSVGAIALTEVVTDGGKRSQLRPNGCKTMTSYLSTSEGSNKLEISTADVINCEFEVNIN
jgi:hypothetical protein